jgi:hypothetical protein
MNMDLLTPNPKVTSRPIEYASPTTLAHSDRRWPPPGLLKGALMRLQHYLPRFRGARGLLVASFRTANIPETWAERGHHGWGLLEINDKGALPTSMATAHYSPLGDQPPIEYASPTTLTHSFNGGHPQAYFRFSVFDESPAAHSRMDILGEQQDPRTCDTELRGPGNDTNG